MTEDALKKCGFSDKKIGDEITFVYEINEKREAKPFEFPVFGMDTAIQTIFICQKPFVTSRSWMRYIMVVVIFLFVKNGCRMKRSRLLLTV